MTMTVGGGGELGSDSLATLHLLELLAPFHPPLQGDFIFSPLSRLSIVFFGL